MCSEHNNDKYNTELTDIGSCGLQVVHGEFQTGNRIVGWK